MEKVLTHLEEWFIQRPLWLQDAACRIIQKGNLDSADLAELTLLCKREAGITDPNTPKIRPQGIPEGSLRVNGGFSILLLEEISNVRGINALSPRNPLKLSEGPLTIIYGGTGSGKSGYVRILKHACGGKGAGELHGNIFGQQDSDKGCTFKAIIDAESKEFNWSPETGVIDAIKTTEIYDTDCAHVYLTEENEVAYEPWILSLFTQLTKVCTHIGKTLKDEIDHSLSIIPSLPIEFQGVVSASWYSNLSLQITQKDIDERCFWDQNLEDVLATLNNRLSEPDPAKQAKQLRTKKTNLLALNNELKKIRDKLTDVKCSEYLNAKGGGCYKKESCR